jgi:predicted amidohydrolase YtcJ
MLGLGLSIGPAEAGTAYVNGKIVTLDHNEAIVQAMVVDNGKVVAVGADEEMRKLAGEVVDLGGKTVLPGFIETHCHSIGAARAEISGPYAELYSIADVQRWVSEQAKVTPKGEWIEVPRNEITRLKERRFPTPAELDVATTDHPVLFVSVTKTVLNGEGWRALGVTAPDSKVPGGEVLWEDGKPVLMRGGSAAVRALMRQPLAPSKEALRAKLKELFGIYNSVGITSIFERATDRAGYDLFSDLSAKQELTARVRATFRFSAKDGKGAEAYIRKLGLTPAQGDDWVRATTMKITVDGGIHWGTTWLSEAYGDKRTSFYRNSDPAYTGEHNYTPEQMVDIFATVNRLGWPMSTHVTGDGGAMAVLRAVQTVALTQPNIKDRRFTLIHCYFPDPAMAALAKEVNAGVDTQEYLFYRDSDFISKIYGENWADRFMGLKTWMDAGVPVAINSDHMIGFDPNHAMNAFNPFLMMYCAVTRRNDAGDLHGPGQKLSRLDALRTVTQWAAWLSFDEKKLGTLEKGKLADFVVLDRDYLTCPEEEIKAIRPVTTVVGGRRVWNR